ncbi:MAG: hypothetical protein K2X93_03865 [Candidatus Obscuribacterales bacterium]|nr:hypothetical protein [Candidatus Obscuribacterales bacterium]
MEDYSSINGVSDKLDKVISSQPEQPFNCLFNDTSTKFDTSTGQADAAPVGLFNQVMGDFPLKTQVNAPLETRSLPGSGELPVRDNAGGQADGGQARKLVDDLGSENFDVRQKATKELRDMGRLAVPALAAGLRSPDLEVRRRAEILVGDSLGLSRVEHQLFEAKYQQLIPPTGTKEHIMQTLASHFSQHLKAAKQALAQPELKALLREFGERKDLDFVSQADRIKRATVDLRLDYASCLLNYARYTNPNVDTPDFSDPFALEALHALATALHEDPSLQESRRFRKLCAFVGIDDLVNQNLHEILKAVGKQPPQRLPVGPVKPSNDEDKQNEKNKKENQPTDCDFLHSIDTFAKLAFARMKLSTLAPSTMRDIGNYRDNYKRWGRVETDPDLDSTPFLRATDY